MGDLGISLTTEGVGGTMVVRQQCRQDYIWATAYPLIVMVGTISMVGSVPVALEEEIGKGKQRQRPEIIMKSEVEEMIGVNGV